MGTIVTISGPSASGKTHFLRSAISSHPNIFQRVITHTTRPPRDGEVNGVDYHFVTEEAFNELISVGDIYESSGLCGGRYGTSVTALKQAAANGIGLLVVDPFGVGPARAVAETLGLSFKSVFISTPHEVCLARLKQRADFKLRVTNLHREASWGAACEYDIRVPLIAPSAIDLLSVLIAGICSEQPSPKHAGTIGEWASANDAHIRALETEVMRLRGVRYTGRQLVASVDRSNLVGYDSRGRLVLQLPLRAAMCFAPLRRATASA